MDIQSLLTTQTTIHPSTDFVDHAQYSDSSLYDLAHDDRLAFWESQAEKLHWFKRWDSVLTWNRPYATWFDGGKLNAAYNCLDFHKDTSNWTKPAIIWEGEDGTVRTFTYSELTEHVCRLANALESTFNIQAGDRVTLYMPMIPELAIAVLACARIGAIHSVVFGGFSSQSIQDRVIDSGSKLLITANAGWRRGNIIDLKSMVDTALTGACPTIESVLVVNHIPDHDTPWEAHRDYWYHDAIAPHSSQHVARPMNAEDILFILYTSGTTGKPKGIIHTTGGYLTHAKYSTKLVFDLRDSDVYWCTADVGWITGHTYFIYGPLSNGATTLMFEGTPDYPNKNRFWQLIETHKVSIFYTAPTAIRAFMKWGTEWLATHDLSSLRLLGTVGEPINPEAWLWYYEHVGHSRCPIVDTWWQTETGGIMISTIPGVHSMKPGYAGQPLPGISATILTQSGDAVTDGGGLLSITEPWPSMLRGVWGNPDRFNDVYWSTFNTYFAGDGAKRDADGYFMVLGRVDDVLNVAGHRIGTMEVESALVDCNGVAESAVVGIDDPIKGQAILAFVILKHGIQATDHLKQELIQSVSDSIGPIAKPSSIIFTPDLPKTRSGKIMRRILKNIANNQPIGDTMTLANPDIVDSLIASMS